MSKRPPNLRVRIEFEPNRFASNCLVKTYERLKPVDSRIISNEHQENEKSKTIAVTEGGKK